MHRSFTSKLLFYRSRPMLFGAEYDPIAGNLINHKFCIEPWETNIFKNPENKLGLGSLEPNTWYKGWPTYEGSFTLVQPPEDEPTTYVFYRPIRHAAHWAKWNNDNTFQISEEDF